jgi:xylulokinase
MQPGWEANPGPVCKPNHIILFQLERGTFMQYLLGIDIGTSGTKTALFDYKGHTITSSTTEYPMIQPKNGWAEQDPLDWWKAVVTGIQKVLGYASVQADDIAGIGLSGQMHGLVMLDNAGKVLRPSIIWCDQRTARQCEEIEVALGRKRLIEITANPALTGFTAGKILWVRENEPDIYAKCAHILLPKDYIRYMLTGEYATEVSDASGMQLLDVPGRCWSDEVLSKLSIDKRLLGKVYESPEITGAVSSQAAEMTGLRKGTPVAGGAGDNAAAAAGTGVVRNGKAFTTIGTSGVVFAHTDRVTIDMKGRVHTFCCAVPGAWHVMGVTQAAGLSLKWFRDTFYSAEKQAAEIAKQDIYAQMDAQAALSPIGANRLFYLPYLMGERTPHLDADARGVFFGLSGMHQKRDLLRAVMEGVSYSLKDCLAVFDEMGLTVSQMAACGGGSRSPLWKHMLADLYGCDIVTIATEGPALGVALMAGVGACVYKNLPEACDIAIRTGETITPDPEDAKRYSENYLFFRKLYPALKDAYKDLASL